MSSLTALCGGGVFFVAGFELFLLRSNLYIIVFLPFSSFWSEAVVAVIVW